MICPVYEDKTIHSNYEVWTKENKSINVNLFNKSYALKEVDYIDGTIILNRDIVGQTIFDENIFIYFETMDLCKRLIQKNIRLYAMDQITFKHYGSQSHNKKYNHHAQLSRCWHYNWSKFYYLNKHQNYLYALKKIYPNFKTLYKPDFRQKIASSWPSSIDDSVAKKDWNWNPLFGIDEMTKIMIEELKLKQKTKLQKT